MKKITAIHERARETVDQNGELQKEWNEVAKIKGILLPDENSIAAADEGTRKKVRYEFFYKGKNRDIEGGDRLHVNGLELYITSCLDYGKVLDIVLEGEIE